MTPEVDERGPAPYIRVCSASCAAKITEQCRLFAYRDCSLD